jgi:Ca-activated chloride channel homolog
MTNTPCKCRAALQDPAIIAALLYGQDKLALIQWSGIHNRRLSVPWTTLQTPQQVATLSNTIRQINRPQDHTDTAIGEALYFALAQFPDAADCQRRVIDLSGDGAENAGKTLFAARSAVLAQGITLNAIAIEQDGEDTSLSGYFQRFVISRDGFVVTARGLADYPRAIHEKLLRELTKAVS